MRPTQLINTFQQARKSSTLAVIEGLQALKHAARFEAQFADIITSNLSLLKQLLAELAPDVQAAILANVNEVDNATFNKLSPQPPRTKVIALAQRKTYTLTDVKDKRPIVFLEDPRDLENIGAVIRVAAAANAGAVIISGNIDIWHPAIIRGAAGLHYAIPCFSYSNGSSLEIIKMLCDIWGAKAYAFDADDVRARLCQKASVPKNSVLIFGSERAGVNKPTLDAADHIVKLPMQKGVSSLNLATSVAAALYMM